MCGPQLETLCIYNAIDLKRYSPLGEKIDLDALAGLAAGPPGHRSRRTGGNAGALERTCRVPASAGAAAQRSSDSRLCDRRARFIKPSISQRTLDQLRALAADLGIAEKVGFTGYVADTAGAIRSLDILVHASTQPEPFGRVIAEGMACGRAVICSAAGGAAELITEGQDALAHPPGDDAALAARIVELVRDPELRARLGRAGRITAERRFERGRLSAQLIPLYRKLSGQPRQNPRSNWR